MKNFKIEKNSRNKAFTLIESLVAISILMVSITSVMQLAQKGLSTASQAKDEMVASLLVQDAIESVRGIRDEIGKNGSTGDDWLTGPTPTSFLQPCICNPTAGDFCSFDTKFPDNPIFCKIDTTASNWDNAVTPGFTLISSKLKISYTIPDFNGVRHFLKYDYTGANCDNSNSQYVCDSKYSRYINIIRDPTNTNLDEAVITVRVTWDSPMGIQKTPDIQAFIYNISENL